MEIITSKAEQNLQKILSWLENYKIETNCEGVVLGLSGGKDSTVVAMLAKKVWGNNVFGLLMPNGKQSDLSDAITIAKSIGLEHRIVNLETIYNNLIHNIEYKIIRKNFGSWEHKDFAPNCPRVTDKAKTNIPPRLRMTILYAVGQSLGFRVIGTGNASEIYIGWTTKFGDSAYDLNPIAHLTCSEVIEVGKILAKEYGLDEKYVDKPPSDGLTGKTDENNFGFSYATLDAHIRNEPGEYAKEDIDKIEEMHAASEHKRQLPLRCNPNMW